MYKAFLSYQQLKEYLLVLEENGLLAHDETGMTFRTTPRGHQFIDIHEKLNELSGLAVVDGIREKRSSKLP
jgi:predicted transcriptional regulator